MAGLGHKKGRVSMLRKLKNVLTSVYKCTRLYYIKMRTAEITIVIVATLAFIFGFVMAVAAMHVPLGG